MCLTPTLTKLGVSTTTTHSIKEKSFDLALKGTLTLGHSGLPSSELLDSCSIRTPQGYG